MERDFFQNLPTEITTNILSRLPLRAIAISKCVSPWLLLLESHLSQTKPSPALGILMPASDSTRCTVFQLEDEDGVDLESHEHHYYPLTNFDFPHGSLRMECTAADGLLLLLNRPDTLYICNPLTRDYVELSSLKKSFPEDWSMPKWFHFHRQHWLTYGFGVSKISGQHKVVCINPARFGCHYYVYTLGTGSWRRVEATAMSDYTCNGLGVFVNGNLHWTVMDSDGNLWICCFDVETECFSIFSAPRDDDGVSVSGMLSVLRDCLCVCSNFIMDDDVWNEEIAIWLMKEYGVEKSWTKEYVMNLCPEGIFRGSYTLVWAIKVFKDGDILMSWNEKIPFYYSNKTKTTQQVRRFDANEGNKYVSAMILTPTFLSLKTFEMENVISF